MMQLLVFSVSHWDWKSGSLGIVIYAAARGLVTAEDQLGHISPVREELEILQGGETIIGASIDSC